MPKGGDLYDLFDISGTPQRQRIAQYWEETGHGIAVDMEQTLHYIERTDADDD